MVEMGPLHVRDRHGKWTTMKNCSCEWCEQRREHRRSVRLYNMRLKQQDGKRATQSQHDEAVAILAMLYGRGMSFLQMSDLSGVNNTTLWEVVNETDRVMSPRTYRAIMAVPDWTPPSRGLRRGGRYIDSTGTIRRLLALQAVGFSFHYLADQLGYTGPQMLSGVARAPERRVSMEFAHSVATLYDKLSNQCADDFGIRLQTTNRLRSVAARKRIPTPACWDDDTIDDPKALAQWTGRCGSVAGYRLHQAAGIQACEPCASAWRKHGGSDGNA